MRKKFDLTYGSKHVSYEVALDPRRSTRIAIHVEPNGAVHVDVPPDFSEAAVRQAVQKRARWVFDHVAKAHQRYAHVRPKEYVSGEQVLYQGRRYVLKVLVSKEAVEAVRLYRNRLEVQSQTGDREKVRSQMKAWYRARANEYFARRLEYLVGKLPWVAEPPPFRLLEMSRRWGSCSKSGQIILNPQLVKAPRDCIEYVIVHELAHLKHHDHGAAFWRLIDRHCPDWRRSKNYLDGLVEVLLRD